jgi:hypothetical protein
MVTYEMLALCIRSGQMDVDDIAQAFRDEVFARWYRKRFGF